MQRSGLPLVLLQSDDGRVFPLAPRAVPGCRGIAFFVELGYAMTIHKCQGQTFLGDLYIFADCGGRGWPAAGYVAITRVKDIECVKWFGMPSKDFFVPARQAAAVRRQPPPALLETCGTVGVLCCAWDAR